MWLVTKDHERILRREFIMKKAILYITQFFGQIGGVDKADVAPTF